MAHTLVIRNMVCDRCIAAVRGILDAVALEPIRVSLGEVELPHAPAGGTLMVLGERLRAAGFDLVEDRDSATIARVKVAIIEHVRRGDGKRVELAKLVQDAVHLELSSVSKLFSEVEGITLEHYFLLQRLERVKELIRYDELTFSEIAFAAGFSSAAHLSAQFKQLTGMTPTAFRKLSHPARTPLDQVGS